MNKLNVHKLYMLYSLTIEQKILFDYDKEQVEEIAYEELLDITYEMSDGQECLIESCDGQIYKSMDKEGGCSCHMGYAPCGYCTRGYIVDCDTCDFTFEYEGA